MFVLEAGIRIRSLSLKKKKIGGKSYEAMMAF
jgi:hypothetical protein